ncbi:MAG: T9SS type A sorting domain-containing protein [Saprospiraceae bacterium]
MVRAGLACLLMVLGIFNTKAQPSYTALDSVIMYQGEFGYGTNVGAYPPWRDENLANIAAGNEELGLPGLGITCFRPELPELFVDYWGYDIRHDAFAHYDSLGMKDHVLFIGQPAPHHRDTAEYCEGQQSRVFLNLYEPIWDDGMDGTPINDSNYFARYVYLLVQNYGAQVRFWEVWNEPDLDIGGNAPLLPGQPGNWWENDPPACEVQLLAPVYHYIRMLRITYEVVKTYYPEDYVAVGGLGNPSYLDAILRNTDNPHGGATDSLFPLKGGAYFDCMSFHSYPHLDGSLQEWDNDIMGFVYHRHSDAALKGLLDRRKAMQDVLWNRGFDGNSFPQKEWILTETNIPRVAFTPGFIGSDLAQRNFLMKALIACQKYYIRQFHVYSLADVEKVDSANYEFELMGMFLNLSGTQPHAYQRTISGIGYETIAKELGGFHFDARLTDSLYLDNTVNGAVFKNKEDQLKIVLWAVTQIDNSEYALSNFRLPGFFDADLLYEKDWAYAATGDIRTVHPDSIILHGDPRVYTIEKRVATEEQSGNSGLFIFPNPINGSSLFIKMPETVGDNLQISIFDTGGNLQIRELVSKSFVDSGLLKLDVGALENGCFLVQLKGDKVLYSTKLIKL